MEKLIVYDWIEIMLFMIVGLGLSLIFLENVILPLLSLLLTWSNSLIG